MSNSPQFPAGASASNPENQKNRNIALLVWIVWALLWALDFYFVASYGTPEPRMDEWSMVPVLTGNQPVTGEWLWSAHNEHRVPLPRSIILILLTISRGDFRAGMFLNVFILGVLAFGMVRVAQKIRGRPSLPDLFFPLTLLHWGHCENLLWCWQVGFVLPTVLASWVLMEIALNGNNLNPWATARIGIGLALLPLCGGNGVALVPAPALWLAGCGVKNLFSRDETWRRKAKFHLFWALVAMGITGLYFVGFQRPPHGPEPDVPVWLGATWRIISLSIGLFPIKLWPFFSVVVPLELLGGLILLAVVGKNIPSERFRVSGLFAFLVAIGMLTLAIGYARGEPGPMAGVARRYTTLSVPILLCVFFVLVIYGRPVWSRCLQWWMVLSAAGMICFFDFKYGTEFGEVLLTSSEAFQKDIRAGMGPLFLADRHSRMPSRIYSQNDKKTFPGFLEMLRTKGIGQFQAIKPDPPFQFIKLDEHMANRPDGNQFVLKEPRFVYGIRVTYLYHPVALEAFFQATWSKAIGPSNSLTKKSDLILILQREKEETLLVPINDQISQFALYPDNKPYSCEIREVELTVPPQ